MATSASPKANTIASRMRLDGPTSNTRLDEIIEGHQRATGRTHTNEPQRGAERIVISSCAFCTACQYQYDNHVSNGAYSPRSGAPVVMPTLDPAHVPAMSLGRAGAMRPAGEGTDSGPKLPDASDPLASHRESQ
jgi:hypothetical protein